MNCNLEKISDFNSLYEFKRFIEWINEQEKIGNIEKIQVEEPYIGTTLFDEKWIRCKMCGTVWRIVAPDPPFAGVFEPINNNN